MCSKCDPMQIMLICVSFGYFCFPFLQANSFWFEVQLFNQIYPDSSKIYRIIAFHSDLGKAKTQFGRLFYDALNHYLSFVHFEQRNNYGDHCSWEPSMQQELFCSLPRICASKKIVSLSSEGRSNSWICFFMHF